MSAAERPRASVAVSGSQSGVSRDRVTVVLITKNEERRIERCLASVAWADEIVVVDDESSDRTQALCRACGATVIVRPSGGDFDQQRNAGIDAASGEWILQLDADEVVSPALREEIRGVLERSTGVVAYRVRRQNVFLGREMRYGGWGWNGVKLFRKLAARYVGHSVHETLAVNGSVGELAQPIQHYPFQSLTQFIERQNFYSDVEARLLRESHATVTEPSLRYQLLVRPLKLFWKSYVKQSGYREGLHGLVFAALFAWTHFLKWAKWWEAGLARAEPRPLGSVEPVRGMPARAAGRPAGAVPDRETLSVVILTKDEEGKIGRCLASVRWADEVIVVDGESQDRTPEIARAFGATVVSHAFDGSFATDRNLGMAHAHGEWVLQIDADERVTPELAEEIRTLLAPPSHGGAHGTYAIPRRNYIGKTWLRHGGWYPSAPLKLFKKSAFRWEETTVHPRAIGDGSCGQTRYDLLHYSYRDLADFVAKLNRQTTLEAEKWISDGRRMTLGKALWRSVDRCLRSYIGKQGYKDGRWGFIMAVMGGAYQFLSYAKYWEHTLNPRRR